MTVYTVGRENPKIDLDIIIPRHEETVGRLHINLTCEDDGRYCITDRGALNKTFIMVGGSWRQISEAHVEIETPLMLGSYQTTVKQLLAIQVLQAEQGPPSVRDGGEEPFEPSVVQELAPPVEVKPAGFFARLFGKKG